MSNTISALLHSSNAQTYSKPKNVFGILGKKNEPLKVVYNLDMHFDIHIKEQHVFVQYDFPL